MLLIPHNLYLRPGEIAQHISQDLLHSVQSMVYDVAHGSMRPNGSASQPYLSRNISHVFAMLLPRTFHQKRKCIIKMELHVQVLRVTVAIPEVLYTCSSSTWQLHHMLCFASISAVYMYVYPYVTSHNVHSFFILFHRCQIQSTDFVSFHFRFL